jgi:hypothetical protein
MGYLTHITCFWLYSTLSPPAESFNYRCDFPSSSAFSLFCALTFFTWIRISVAEPLNSQQPPVSMHTFLRTETPNFRDCRCGGLESEQKFHSLASSLLHLFRFPILHDSVQILLKTKFTLLHQNFLPPQHPPCSPQAPSLHLLHANSLFGYSGFGYSGAISPKKGTPL